MKGFLNPVPLEPWLCAPKRNGDSKDSGFGDQNLCVADPVIVKNKNTRESKHLKVRDTYGNLKKGT